MPKEGGAGKHAGMKVIVALIAAAQFSIPTAFGQAIIPGEIDPTFNTGSGFNFTVEAVAVQNDGKIVVGGYFQDYNGAAARSIARLLPTGELDPSFQPGTGANGIVEFVAVTAENKVIIGGNFSTVNGTAQRVVARLNEDGSLDSTFAAVFASGTLNDAVLQPDGKLLVAGSFSSVNGQPFRYFVRLNEDGTVDESFEVYRFISSWPLGLEVDAEGRILVSNGRYTKEEVRREGLYRLHGDGTLDETFNSHEVVFAAKILELLPDGSILADGWGLTRLFPDGRQDSVFDMRAPFPNGAFALGDGRIVAHPVAWAPAVLYMDGTVQFELPEELEGGVNAVAQGPNGTLYVGGGFAKGIARIYFHEREAEAKIEWNGSNFAALEEHGRAKAPLLRTGETNTTITVEVRTRSGTAGEADFMATETSVTFEPGEVVEYVEIPLVNDTEPEADERFEVILTLGDGSEDLAQVTIVSDEGFVELVGTQVNVDELSGVARLEMRKTGAIPYAITNQFVVRGTIDPTKDVLWAGNTLTIRAGGASLPRLIQIFDDREAEGTEFMEIELLPPEGNHALGNRTVYRLELADNDRPGIPGEGLDAATRLLATRDGGLVLHGSFRSVHGFPKFWSARLGRDGLLREDFAAYVPTGGFQQQALPTVPLFSLEDGKFLYQVLYTNPFPGFTSEFAFMRLNEDGSRDSSYSTNVAFVSSSTFAVMPDSTVVIAERTNIAAYVSYALHFLGATGQVERSASRVIYPRYNTSERGIRVARQASGHVLVGGDIYGLTNNVGVPHEAMAYGKNLLRFNPDGTPDLTFQHAMEAQLGWTIHDLKVLPDDRILIAGNPGKVGGVAKPPLTRLMANGAVDGSFAADFSFLVSGLSNIIEVLPLKSGKLLLRLNTVDGRTHLFALNENGALDEEFPRREFDPGLLISVVELADGRIAVSGNFREFDGEPRGRLAYLSAAGELLHDQPLEILGFEATGETLEFEVASRLGGTLSLQGSTDLREWNMLESAPAFPGRQVILAAGDAATYRFYRAVVE